VAQRGRLRASLDAAGEDALLRVGADIVAVTHLDRIYWPAWPERGQAPLTKRDYLRYLVDVAAVMLPHLRDRPLTLFRWPEGIARRRVLEKHWLMRLPPFVERVNVFSESKQSADQYVLCNNVATLLWLAQMGVLELHAWHARTRPGRDAPDAGRDFARSAATLRKSLLERPDYVLFDIDPFIGAAGDARGASRISTRRPSSARARSHCGSKRCWPGFRSHRWSRPRARPGCT